jgi:2-C-methyl-D-erythritol 4-phosphate cytidylyltransferase
MQAKIPKQYLELQGMPIACHSFVTFAKMPETREIVIVCEPDWRCAVLVIDLMCTIKSCSTGWRHKQSFDM